MVEVFVEPCFGVSDCYEVVVKSLFLDLKAFETTGNPMIIAY